MMKFRLTVPVALLAGWLAGCSTPSGTPAGSRTAAPAVADAEPPPAGFYAIWVESEPTGGTVVVDGVPQGKTPLRIVVPGTARGFFRSGMSIRVRFVATEAARLSATMEESFTPTDRIPSRLTYTPADVHRTR
ncbi:hypothetical protein MASR2M8_18810 [Opitutaceae bacterium]